MPTTQRRSWPRSADLPTRIELPSVEVSLSSARDRGLPLISVHSGREADGYAPAGRPVGSILVPLTQSEFDRLMVMRSRQRSGLYGMPGFLLAGLVLGRFGALIYLGVAISIVSGLLWAVATLGIMRLLPAAEVDPSRGSVALGRVHRGFVKAVEEARREP